MSHHTHPGAHAHLPHHHHQDCCGALHPIEVALGGIAASSDRWMFTSEKGELSAIIQEHLAKVQDPDTRDAIALLAAVVFGIVRRMGYVFLATRYFGDHADPDLVRIINADNQRVEDVLKRFDQERADAADVLGVQTRIAEEWCTFIHPLHQAILDRSEAGADLRQELQNVLVQMNAHPGPGA